MRHRKGDPMSKVKLCRRCGQKDEVHSTLLEYDGPRVMSCRRCRIIGPSADSLAAAVKAWNRMQAGEFDAIGHS